MTLAFNHWDGPLGRSHSVVATIRGIDREFSVATQPRLPPDATPAQVAAADAEAEQLLRLRAQEALEPASWEKNGDLFLLDGGWPPRDLGGA